METLKNVNDSFVGFNGADQWYRHQLTQYVYTQGVKEIAELYEAHWLIDQILILNRSAKEFGEDFQCWIFKRVFVNDEPTTRFSLSMDDGNEHLVFALSIHFSDFAGDIVKFYFENTTLYLPEER